MRTTTALIRLSNDDLLAEVKRAAAHERQASVQLLALLGEVEGRRLYLREGYSSLFTYCIQVLHLSEDAAFFRIEAARAAREYPVILDMLKAPCGTNLPHSARSAASGSVREARRAGTITATNAISPRNATTPASRSGSVAVGRHFSNGQCHP